MNLGLRAAAKALGISHVALLKAVTAGRVKRAADGTFDIEACRKALETNSNPGKQAAARSQQQPKKADASPPASAASRPPDATAYNEACRLHELEKLEARRLDNARKRGELVPIAEVNAYIAGMVVKARDILLQIDCADAVRDEIHRALRELSEYVG